MSEINKVIYGNETLMDLTEDTVTEDKVLEGETFHNRAGEKKSGTLAPLATSVNEEHFNIDESKQLSLSSDVTKKLPMQFLGSVSGAVATFTDALIGTKDLMFDIYCSNSERYIKSQSRSGNTLTVEFNDSVAGMVCVAVGIEKGV